MHSLRFHIIQHVSFEGPGYIADWIQNNRHFQSTTNLYNNEKFPLHDSYDVLVIMGGPMGVYDEGRFPWLKTEKQFISEAVLQNKKILGICLGSQLLASVLGAKVYANSEKEIGFMPVVKIKNNALFNHFPDTAVVFQWHGDTFDLPLNATLLASSDACINQAFSVNNNIIGLQFHLEVTPDSISDLLKYGKHELIEKPYIQNESEIISNYKFIPTCHLLLEEILESLITI